MQSEDYLAAALRALAEQDAGREAPESVEARLLQAFRRKQARRQWRNGLGWFLAAAAAGLAIFFVAGSHERPKPVAPAPVPRQLVAAVSAPAEIAAAAPKQVRPVRRRPIEPIEQPRETFTQFFPLLDVAPPFERGELVRVVVPASTMRKVGLPVNQDHLTDRVYADVLVGQEGLARAIRFVSYEQ
jgi:hypothetical protein